MTTTIAESVRELAACPRCHAGMLVRCSTKRGVNHTERVRAAILEALRGEAELRGTLGKAFGIR